METTRRKGIPSARRMASLLDKANNERLGELAISCVGELLGVLRTFVAEEVESDKYMSGYLVAFDRATKREMSILGGLSRELKAELGVCFCTRGGLDEFLAYDRLLKAPEGTGDDGKEKKKKAGKTLKEELEKILPGWLPDWLETIINSILSLL